MSTLEESVNRTVPTPSEEDATGTTTIGSFTALRRPQAEVGANVQRCLILGSRGISHRERHLLKDFLDMIPHGRPESKVKVTSGGLSSTIGDLCHLRNCNTVLLLDAHKASTMMWVGQYPNGPSMCFTMANLTTSRELKLTGNCLKYSRPVLHFDHEFSVQPHLRILRALLTNVFGTPNKHPKSKPFIDHVFCFFYADGHIWFRNYQIHVESNVKKELLEIGPRFALEPHLLHDGFLRGATLWSSMPRASGNGTSSGASIFGTTAQIAKRERLLSKRRAIPKAKKQPGVMVPDNRMDPQASLFRETILNTQ